MMGKKPAIRFEGYTEDWEQRKFGDLYVKVSKKNDMRYGRDDIISVANMYYKPDSYITEDSYLLTYNVFELGDIAFEGNKSKNFAHGRFVENTIGNGIVSHVFDVFHPIMQTYDLLFWKYLINNERIMGKILIRCTKASTMMTNLVANDFLRESIFVPSYKEQKAVGLFLSRLDHLITLHERNHEKMVATKKSMLEKLFPQGDAKVPAIRFEGFEGDWEKRPLGELFVEYSEKGHEELPPLMIVQGGGTVLRNESDRKLVYNKENLSGYKLVRKGDFIVHLRSFEGGLEIATTTGIISPAYHTFHGESVDSDFYYAYFRSRKFIDIDLRRHVYGIRDGRSIDINGMKTILIPYTSLEEQKQIADYLNSLDDLIALYRIRVEKLKNIKAACLQGMFA